MHRAPEDAGVALLFTLSHLVQNTCWAQFTTLHVLSLRLHTRCSGYYKYIVTYVQFSRFCRVLITSIEGSDSTRAVIKTFRDFLRIEVEGMKVLMNELATGNNFIFKSSFLELINLTLVACTNDDEKKSLIGAYHKNGITFHFFQVWS